MHCLRVDQYQITIGNGVGIRISFTAAQVYVEVHTTSLVRVGM